MSRRSRLWLTGAAAVLLFLLLASFDRRMWDAGGPGIVGFELATTPDRSELIRQEWGEPGRDAALASLLVDYLYLLAYGAFVVLAVQALSTRPRSPRWGELAARAALLAPAADACENTFLLIALGGHGWAALPGAVFAAIKFAALAVASVFLLSTIVREHRRRALLGGVASLLVGATVLALNARHTAGETRAARADGGQILDVAGRGIHIRDEGDKDKPTLVLIHGFACSLRWWDAVTPTLVKTHRVVRIDLLGHGGSEKPETGYAMHEQAGYVRGAMDALGIEAATVVGHSMGGVVATALAESSPERVERLMVIGTAPRAGYFSLLRRVATTPLVGPAIRAFVPGNVQQAEVEKTFSPTADVPETLAHDVGRTTYTAFAESAHALAEYWDEQPLDERLDPLGIPVTALFGSTDDAGEHAEDYRNVTGSTLLTAEGAGHAPQVERPAATARQILAAAAQ